ncbi:hypothetical protein BSY240_4595 (plasmid) [Agrobacterium sp. RAC06]|nr:hypothetical protein BSY240_4595 [Agrobacterium sp. RAC06]
MEPILHLCSLYETKWIMIVLAPVTVITTYLLWYPGALSFDSFGQLSQARNGVFSDGWPRLFSLLWGYLDSGVAP